MPLPEAVGIVIGGVLFFTVLTGIGLAVTMAVASAMLKYRSEAARMHLCRFGDVQFLPDRLKWTLDKAALRDFVFRPGIAPWSLLAGMTAVAAILLQWELSLLKDPPSMLVSIAPAVAALSLAGLAAAAGALVFWRGRRFIRSRQEYACREIIGDSAARWEKIAAAAVPKLKELQELSGEIIAVGETAGWRLTTEAPPQHGSGGLSRYLGSDDDTLRLNYLSAAARYFAGHPGQRWRDDTALIRLALDAAQRDLRKGKAAFPDAAACYWEALAAGWMPRICYTVAWWTGGGSARGRWSEDATGAQQPACCRCWLISASLLSCRTRGCMACFWPLRPRCCWSACAPSSAAAFSSANIRRRYRQAVVADRGSRPCDNSRGAGWRGVVITLIVHRLSCCSQLSLSFE